MNHRTERSFKILFCCFRKSHQTLTTSLSRNSSASEHKPAMQNRFIQKSFRHLIGRFNDRAKRMRTRLDIPPTPSSTSSLTTSTPPHQKILFGAKNDDNDDVVVIKSKIEEKSLAGKQPKAIAVESSKADENVKARHSNCSIFCCCSGPVLDPQGRFYISWLFIVTLSFLYNAFVIPLRTSFPFQTPENYKMWMLMDAAADVVYVMDILFVKHRTMYLFDGFWIRDRQLTRKNYMRKFQFKMDVASLLPLDLLYLHPFFGTSAVYLRIPRFLKVQTFWEFFKLLDRIIASPHMLRVGKTLSYMLYMIHLTACTYYAVSYYKGDWGMIKLCFTLKIDYFQASAPTDGCSAAKAIRTFAALLSQRKPQLRSARIQSLTKSTSTCL